MRFVEKGKAQRRWSAIATLKETDSVPHSALKRFGPRARPRTVVGRHRAWQGFDVQISHALKRHVVLRERLWRGPAKDDLCHEQRRKLSSHDSVPHIAREPPDKARTVFAMHDDHHRRVLVTSPCRQAPRHGQHVAQRVLIDPRQTCQHHGIASIIVCQVIGLGRILDEPFPFLDAGPDNEGVWLRRAMAWPGRP